MFQTPQQSLTWNLVTTLSCMLGYSMFETKLVYCTSANTPDAPNVWIIYLPTWKVNLWPHEQEEMAG